MLIMVKNLRKGKPGAGEGQRAEGAGAWHITARHSMDTWHCDIWGAHGDNCEVQ